MSNRIRSRRVARKPFAVRFTVASRVLVNGQHLRADEAAVATTFAIHYAATRQEAARGR